MISDVLFDARSLCDVDQELEDTKSYHCCWAQLTVKGYGQQRSKGFDIRCMQKGMNFQLPGRGGLMLCTCWHLGGDGAEMYLTCH